MQQLEVRCHGTTVSLVCADFNRLRWTVQALRLNPGLAEQLGNAHGGATVVDSVTLLKGWPLPEHGTVQVVLWDGLNSLLELQARYPDALSSRPDTGFLVVGTWADVLPGLPSASLALFPAAVPASPGRDAGGALQVPIWFPALGGFRALMRPVKNRKLDPQAHRQLQQGGKIVFCGLVRPNTAVLDNFFRGAALALLRGAADALTTPNDDIRPTELQAHLQPVYTALRQSQLMGAADCAAAYAVLSVLHRMLTLSLLRQSSKEVVVKAYGIDVHFDPYDTSSYRHNLFLDFGSSRGPDAVYPRVVDLLVQQKVFLPCRMLAGGQRLVGLVEGMNFEGFVQRCEHDAAAAVQRLKELPASRRA